MTDPSAKAKQRKRTILMTALGVASGVIVSLDVLELSPLVIGGVHTGLVFGVIFALYLIATRRSSSIKGLGMIIAFTASWMIAYRLVNALIHIPVSAFLDDLPTGLIIWLDFFVIGSVVGLVQSALLVVSLFALFGYFRSSRLRTITVTVGALTGGALTAISFSSFFVEEILLVIFPVWQGAFAFCFSLALTEDDQRRGLPKDTSRPT